MIPAATIASMAIPVGDVRKLRKEVGIGWTMKRTFPSADAFLKFIQVAEFEVVLVGGLLIPAGTTTFT